MTFRWLEEISEFQNIAEDWDKTLTDSGTYNPFLLSDFIITWWKHFHESRSLRIFVVFDGDRIIGGIPLSIRRGDGMYKFARILSYIGGSAANYTEPLYATAGTRLLPRLKEALRKKRDWDVLYLSDVREGNGLISEYNAGHSDISFNLHLISDHTNWAIDLSGGEKEYLSSLSSKMKRDLRAKRVHLMEKFGEVRLKEVRGEDEIEKLFDLYTKFSMRTFEERGRNSSFEEDRYAAFFREFLLVMDRQHRLDAHVLSAGDKPLAVSFGYRFGKGLNWVLTGFNYDYKYYRPGYILIEELIKEVLRRGETYYNWYGYERFYKSQWCNIQSPLYRLFLIRKSLRGNCYKAVQVFEKNLRFNRTIVGMVRKIRRS